MGLQDVRSVRAARHGDDVPDDVPEDVAQRPVRRRAGERALRGRSRRCAACGSRRTRARSKIPAWRGHIDKLRPPVEQLARGHLGVGEPVQRPRGADAARLGSGRCRDSRRRLAAGELVRHRGDAGDQLRRPGRRARAARADGGLSRRGQRDRQPVGARARGAAGRRDRAALAGRGADHAADLPRPQPPRAAGGHRRRGAARDREHLLPDGR